MAIEMRTLGVPLEPYPEGVALEVVDRQDTFLGPDGRYYGECFFRTDWWDEIPEDRRVVLAVKHRIEGFRHQIYRAATLEDLEGLLWNDGKIT